MLTLPSVWYGVQYAMGVTKGIILAAGYGTRFLPATKLVPKELFPIGNRPALDLIIEEFIASGIKEVCIVISPRKRIIAQQYRPLRALERHLQRSNRPALLQRIALPSIRIRFLFQRTMRGTGHALLQTRQFVGNEPVIVAYPDDIHFGATPLTKQLIACYDSLIATEADAHATNRISGDTAPPDTQISIMSATRITSGHEKYGILALDSQKQMVRGIVEKPNANQAPSDYASIGRFLFQPNFFDYLASGWRAFDKRNQREYYHIHALKQLIAINALRCYIINGQHFDVGNPDGYVAALNAYAAKRL